MAVVISGLVLLAVIFLFALLITYFSIWSPDQTQAQYDELLAQRWADFKRNPVSALVRFLISLFS